MPVSLVRAMRAKAFLHPFLLVLAAIGVLTLVVLGFFPKLITGDYCKVTIVSIKVDERGHTELVWEGIHSSGTSNSGWSSVNGVRRQGGGGGGGGFPAWPVTCGATTSFSLNRQHEDLDRATLLSRLKVI